MPPVPEELEKMKQYAKYNKLLLKMKKVKGSRKDISAADST